MPNKRMYGSNVYDNPNSPSEFSDKTGFDLGLKNVWMNNDSIKLNNAFNKDAQNNVNLLKTINFNDDKGCVQKQDIFGDFLAVLPEKTSDFWQKGFVWKGVYFKMVDACEAKE